MVMPKRLPNVTFRCATRLLCGKVLSQRVVKAMLALPRFVGAAAAAGAVTRGMLARVRPACSVVRRETVARVMGFLSIDEPQR